MLLTVLLSIWPRMGLASIAARAWTRLTACQKLGPNLQSCSPAPLSPAHPLAGALLALDRAFNLSLLTLVGLLLAHFPSLSSLGGSSAPECIHGSLQFGAKWKLIEWAAQHLLHVIDKYMKQDRSLERPLQLSTCYRPPDPYNLLTTAI